MKNTQARSPITLNLILLVAWSLAIADLAVAENSKNVAANLMIEALTNTKKSSIVVLKRFAAPGNLTPNQNLDLSPSQMRPLSDEEVAQIMSGGDVDIGSSLTQDTFGSLAIAQVVTNFAGPKLAKTIRIKIRPNTFSERTEDDGNDQAYQMDPFAEINENQILAFLELDRADNSPQSKDLRLYTATELSNGIASFEILSKRNSASQEVLKPLQIAPNFLKDLPKLITFLARSKKQQLKNYPTFRSPLAKTVLKELKKRGKVANKRRLTRAQGPSQQK